MIYLIINRLALKLDMTEIYSRFWLLFWLIETSSFNDWTNLALKGNSQAVIIIEDALRKHEMIADQRLKRIFFLISDHVDNMFGEYDWDVIRRSINQRIRDLEKRSWKIGKFC